MTSLTTLQSTAVRAALSAILATLSLASSIQALDTRALIEQYVAVWNGGDPSLLDSTLADDFVRHGNYGSASSRAELGELVAGFREF